MNKYINREIGKLFVISTGRFSTNKQNFIGKILGNTLLSDYNY
jgi:hypothetical protein